MDGHDPCPRYGRETTVFQPACMALSLGGDFKNEVRIFLTLRAKYLAVLDVEGKLVNRTQLSFAPFAVAVYESEVFVSMANGNVSGISLSSFVLPALVTILFPSYVPLCLPASLFCSVSTHSRRRT
jgi:hypothetical protein